MSGKVFNVNIYKWDRARKNYRKNKKFRKILPVC